MDLLPPSEPRCWDSKCLSRQGCRRWLDREERADRNFATYRPLWQCHTVPCERFICIAGLDNPSPEV